MEYGNTTTILPPRTSSEVGTLRVLPAATTATTPAASAESGSPGGYTARPRTLRERLAYLEREARAILREPGNHSPEVLRWAEDMLPAGHVEARP